ncbi:MAG: hypothetical protein ACT4P3_00405 [Betaproteobacteria bacterium]
MIRAAALLLALALPATAADEKPSRAEKEASGVGRALEGAGKNVGRALERTGDNIWIKKGQKKSAPKKKKGE